MLKAYFFLSKKKYLNVTASSLVTFGYWHVSFEEREALSVYTYIKHVTM